MVDSAMTVAEAFAGLTPTCPEEIRHQQAIVALRYWDIDSKEQLGQLVIDKRLEQDVAAILAIAWEHRFPIQSMIPVSHPILRHDEACSDDLSMAADHTSGFNYRPVTGGKTLSNHALGRALDIDPLHNPYIKLTNILPPSARYDPSVVGTLTADHPVPRAFLDRGWESGGHWKSLKSYQHFEKPAR